MRGGTAHEHRIDFTQVSIFTQQLSGSIMIYMYYTNKIWSLGPNFIHSLAHIGRGGGLVLLCLPPEEDVLLAVLCLQELLEEEKEEEEEKVLVNKAEEVPVHCVSTA